MNPEQFCQKTLANLLKISTKRGVNRSNAIKEEMGSVKMYVADLYCKTKMQESQIIQFDGSTTDKLQKLIDEQKSTIEAQKEEIAMLSEIRRKMNKTCGRLMDENNAFRKELGRELPTFLEDTAFN